MARKKKHPFARRSRVFDLVGPLAGQVLEANPLPATIHMRSGMVICPACGWHFHAAAGRVPCARCPQIIMAMEEEDIDVKAS